MFEYEKDGAEIYRRSFATIRAEADLSGLPEDVARVVVRMIHACGQVDLVDDVTFSPDVVRRAREALDAGAPVLCDAEMVASGITRRRLPKDNDVICTLNHPRTPGLAAELGTTRTAAALELWRDRLGGGAAARSPPRRSTRSRATSNEGRTGHNGRGEDRVSGRLYGVGLGPGDPE